MDVAQMNSFSVVAGGADPGRTRCHFRSRVNAPGYSALLRSLLLGIALFLVPATFAQSANDPVIYPRGSAAAEAPSGAGRPDTNSSLYLAVALLLGAGGWWLWLKRKGGLRGGLAGASHLTIAETKSLGSRQYLVVADYDGKKYLLGVCPGSIELLTPLEGGEGKDA
jgi:flagellar protein FliO/FliZ